MTTPVAFRILRIRPLLRLDATIERLDSVQAKCKSCGDESRMSHGCGLTDVHGGVQLRCPACGSIDVLTAADAWGHWVEQIRHDRILALAGLLPEDLDRP